MKDTGGGVRERTAELARSALRRIRVPPELEDEILVRIAIENRFRPSDLFAAASADLGVPRAVEDESLLLALELLHLGTLVHDDVVDSHERRWHLPTLNARHGAGAAVLLGDVAFGLGLEMAGAAAAARARPRLMELFVEAVLEISAAQLRELSLAPRAGLAKREYADLAARKTHVGHLAVAAAGLLGGASQDEMRALFDFRDALGTASQIANDISELQGVRGYREPVRTPPRGPSELVLGRCTVFQVEELVRASDGSRQDLCSRAAAWYRELNRAAAAALGRAGRPTPSLESYLAKSNPIWLRLA